MKIVYFVRLVLFTLIGVASCREADIIEMYSLCNLDTLDGKFYIRGVSQIDPFDTFAQGFTYKKNVSIQGISQLIRSIGLSSHKLLMIFR